MTRVGRRGDRPAYAAMVEAWIADPASRERFCVGENLALDHRISSQRDADFYRRAGLPATGDALERALARYHRDVVRPSPEFTFLSDELNGGNFVGGAAADEGQLSSNLDLARVISLNGLFRELSASGRFPDLTPELSVQAGRVRWLARLSPRAARGCLLA